MAKKILLLIMMCFSVAVGGFAALKAQDPPPQTPRTDLPTVAAPSVQTDLSGTYTGTFDCEPLGLTGPTTLTITGNEFTTADGKTGRIVASTTGGYTSVALQVGTIPTAATVSTTPAAPPVIVSARARKSGTRLTLTPVAGAAVRCSFAPGRGVARGRRDRTPAATGTEVAAPATTVPAPTESPVPSQTPAPSPIPTPTPAEPTPSPTPEPSPTPSGSPTPTPSPSPAEPAPSPTPTPSPSPRG